MTTWVQILAPPFTRQGKGLTLELWFPPCKVEMVVMYLDVEIL